MSGFVIIGAGEAGTRAAFALREQGWTGSVTLIGAEGGVPYERPPLSKPEGAEVQRKAICDEAQLDSAGIDYRPGLAATAINRAGKTVSLSDGRALPYARLLLATGAQPEGWPVRGRNARMTIALMTMHSGSLPPPEPAPGSPSLAPG